MFWTRNRDAPPRPLRATGLYHFALRYPSRLGLAQACDRLDRKGYPIEGAADHGVSEAVYLSDPDNNGLELYADRPRAHWLWRNGQVAMTTEALDLAELLASIDEAPAPARSLAQPDIGHIHLHVADLGKAERFYREFIGLAVTQRLIPERYSSLRAAIIITSPSIPGPEARRLRRRVLA